MEPGLKKRAIVTTIIVVLVLLVFVAGIFIFMKYSGLEKNDTAQSVNNSGGKVIKVDLAAPAGFPEGFPVPPDAVNIDNSTVPAGDNTQLTRLFETKDTPEKVASFYNSYFNDKTHDWSLASTQPQNTPNNNKVILAQDKSGLVMLVNISPMGSGSLINLIFMKTITTNNQ